MPGARCTRSPCAKGRKHTVVTTGSPEPPAGSSGRRNTDFFHARQQFVKCLCWRFPTERLSRSAIESRRHGGYLVGTIDAQVCAFREVLPQQPIGVLVCAALPGASWIAKIDLDSRVDLETIVLCHFGSLIPGQRTTQFFGQGDDGASNRVAYSFGSVS